ncbi:ROK family protein [Galbibacter sp. PAP.153]|uniref:ROK family protein n=1 Tax=Galbibacter sp. PAP.153 TaxID=3104623 RepID=UPI00300A9F7B
MKYSIGVDIGGSHICCSMYEHSNIQILKNTFIHQKVDSKGAANVILNAWADAVTQTIKLAGFPAMGIGIAMPGPFDYNQGISEIKGLGKLGTLYGLNVRKELSDRLGFPGSQVRFINDAAAFSIGESIAGEAKKYSKALAITLGTGLGASFLKNSYPVISSPDVPRGGFLYNQIHKGHLADEVFSTRGLITHYQKISGHQVNNVRELYERVPYDQKAVDCFQWFGKELGQFIRRYAQDFGAGVLIIGGNISRAFDCFGDSLQHEIPDVKIYVSKLGEEAAIIGSALLLDDHYYKNIQPTFKLM